MPKSSPHDLLTKELISSLKLNARIRRLLHRRLDYLSKQLKTPTLNEEKAPKLVQELIDILAACGTTADRTSKLLLGPRSSPMVQPNPTGEEVLEELIRGKTPLIEKGKLR